MLSQESENKNRNARWHCSGALLQIYLESKPGPLISCIGEIADIANFELSLAALLYLQALPRGFAASLLYSSLHLIPLSFLTH